MLDHKLNQSRVHCAVLDGDNVRHGLNAGNQMLKEIYGDSFAQRFGLGFSAIDQEEPRNTSHTSQHYRYHNIA
jgi:adenylylsulfate kinase